MKKNRFALINSNQVVSENQQQAPDGWNVMQQITGFVEGLTLPGLDTEKGDVFKIIRSVPSPWARAHMMSAALRLQYKYDHQKDSLQGMDTLYAMMQDEFKGLIACLALYNDRISVERVDLEYSEDIPEDHNQHPMLAVRNIFELSGAFGNMLFDERKLWTDPKEEFNDQSIPFFQLIRLDGVVIGATSPWSLAFPSEDYDLRGKRIRFYSNGRFIDPNNSLEADELQKLFHYVHELKSNIDNFEAEFRDGIKSLLPVREFFREWAEEIRSVFKMKFPSVEFKERGLLETCDKFDYPFDKLFNIETKIYKTADGKYLLDKEPGTIEFNPSALLLPSKGTRLIKLDPESGFNPLLSTVLKSEVKERPGNYEYFSLPLTSLGLAEFYTSLDELLNWESSNRNLTSRYFEEDNIVEVNLELSIGGIMTNFKKEYAVYDQAGPLKNSVILWPNFTAYNWNKYYLYSDLLHNDENLRARPILADEKDHSALCFSNREKGELFDINRPDKSGPKAKLKVSFDRERVKQQRLKYEVYESEVPFKGIELQFTTTSSKAIVAGYILVNTNRYEKEHGIIDHTHDRSDLGSVNVGIDFGSTNSCATYSDPKTGDLSIMRFVNRRRFILGYENNDHDDFAPAKDLFFFQNDNQEGIIKSVLLLNNELRLNNPQHEKSESISGGFPLFERNLNVLGGNDSIVEVEVNGETERVLHDLKWKREDRFLMNKKAYIKMLWLYINAELFEKGLKPKNLMWAYPSSMPKDLRRTYEFIYREAINFETPIRDAKVNVAHVEDGKGSKGPVAITESEAVCNYALSKGGISLGDNTVFIGFDIGGVTSDILLLVHDKKDQRGLLEMQSSVKVAADRVTKAVASSSEVHKILKHYCTKYGFPIKAIDRIDESTASYFLNVIFGIIEEEPLLEQQLYSQFWAPELEDLNRNHTRGILAIAAYITGMLCFHSGQMLKAHYEKNKASFNKRKLNVRLAYFGKGGKLFEWLPKAISEHIGNDYFRNCFEKGLGIDLMESLVSTFQMGTKKEFLKREVAYGLSSPDSIDFNPESTSEIIGEDGYSFDGKKVQWSDVITPEMIFEFGERFRLQNSGESSEMNYPRFNSFLDAYFDLVKDWGLFDYTILHKERYSFAADKLENYIKTDEDWQASSVLSRKSQLTEDFKFSCSPFLYQASCFLDEIVMPKLFD